jgi:hypothetical protein
MAKIVGISGRKQSGKNTVANFINGNVLQDREMVMDFFINDDGQLAIKTVNSTGEEGYGIFDVTRKDTAFVDYAEKELWPYIKVYHFADYLKDLSINLFGLNAQNVYGTDQQKNELTNIKWENMPFITKKGGHMTHREFLEQFGTKVVRKIKTDAWVTATINKINYENSQLAIIPDVRFPNEVEAIKASGGVVIRLARNLHDSDVECETVLDKNNFDWSNFDAVIDNTDYTIDQLCSELVSLKSLWS